MQCRTNLITFNKLKAKLVERAKIGDGKVSEKRIWKWR